ncbi:MAG: BREX-3 system P-loop-containing protein BrxF [Rhodospirillales bacterium]|nr:BREX-3 system P-loop-containing protein BrxF [Rhodospirillales bacterium]
MVASLSSQIFQALDAAGGSYYRLVLAVGPAGSGKTEALIELANENGWHRLNVNLELAEQLLELTQKQRAVRGAAILGDIVRGHVSNVVLLDNIEMLFVVDLAQDPLRLLQGMSRNRTIVAAWPGQFDGNALTYGEPGHPEARRYLAPQAVIITADEPGHSSVAEPRRGTA